MPGLPSGTLTPARQEYVDRNGSPEFVFAPAAINAGANVRIELGNQFNASRRYAPLDRAVIVNNSTEQLLIIINGKALEGRTIPGSTILTISNTPIITFQITNEDGAAATVANEINVNFSRAALTADELARRYGR